MRAGALRHRIIIQFRENTRGDYGQEVETWADLVTVWAAIWPIKGREYFSADQVQSEITHRIRIRHRRRITPENRISYKGRIFDIRSIINPDERGEYLDIMATEKAT